MSPIGPQRAVPATIAQIRAQTKQVLSQLAESDSKPLEKDKAMVKSNGSSDQ